MAKCKYSQTYFDPKEKKEKQFDCQEDALDSEFCVFHDKNYLNDNSSKIVRDLFIKRLDESISNFRPFVCIEYNLPAINMANKDLPMQIYFVKTVFHGDVIFDKIAFTDNTVFEKTTFKGKTSFLGAEFHELTKFSECIFEKEANFMATIFCQDTVFEYNRFQESLFSLSKFKNIQFYANIFQKPSEFKLLKFNDKTLFQNNVFHDVTDFTESRYEKETSLINNTFFEQTNFRKIYFRNSDQVLIDGNLSKVSFLYSDISKIIFGTNVNWEEQYEHAKTILQKIRLLLKKFRERNNKFKIIDEKNIENHHELDVLLESILAEYRNLRENFDKHLRYSDAGEFFVREHEVKRKFKKNFIHINSINLALTKQKNVLARIFSVPAFYYFIGRYGESYYRPMKIALPGLIFSIIYFWSLGFSNFDLILNNDSWFELMKTSVMRSISAFFPFYGLNSDSGLSDLVLRIALLPISAALFIALRRKLERRYSH